MKYLTGIFTTLTALACTASFVLFYIWVFAHDVDFANAGVVTLLMTVILAMIALGLNGGV